MKSNLIVISGPSGAGKGTIIEKILNIDPKIKFSISSTTRQKRPEEKEGLHYFFIKKEIFLKMIDENEFLEWAKVHDEYYGTSKAYVNSILEKGFDCVLDIDTQGAMQIQNQKVDAVFIFITAPSIEELEKRLIKRGTEPPEKIKKRLNQAENEMNFIDKYNYCITNDNLDSAVKEVKNIIDKIRNNSHSACNGFKNVL